MSKTLNILSLDWDYFIDADMATRSWLFPDCPNENYSSDLQMVIWCSRYLDGRLVEIQTNSYAINMMSKLISFEAFHPERIYIADSHAKCYDFVHELMRTGGFDQLNLMNVDFHHDMYSGFRYVDCGNWLLRLRQDYPEGNYTWIHHPYSDMEMPSPRMMPNFNSNIEHIFDFKWDAVFICRSGMWSPPHLDYDFIDLFKPLADRLQTYVEPDIFISRYGAKFCVEVEKEKQLYTSLHKDS